MVTILKMKLKNKEKVIEAVRTQLIKEGESVVG